MLNSPFFSIIIPVYNVEKYLTQCLESIFEQTFTDYEVILINDGSKDQSLKICEYFTQKHNQIHLINQQNKGLSGARNSGLKIAKGNFVWFVDSDDYLKVNSLEILHNQLSKSPVDVLGFSNYHYIEKNQLLKENNLNPTTTILSNDEFLKQNLLFEIAPWIYVYKRTFLNENNIDFREDIKIHEDEFFLLDVLVNLKTIQCIADRLYIYRIRPNSLMRSDRIEDKLYSISKLIYYIEALKNNYLFTEFWNERLLNSLQQYYRLYFNANKRILTHEIVNDYKKIRLLKLNISKNDLLGIKVSKLLHNYCFPWYKARLLK